MPPRMRPEDARQGRRGTPVLVILIVALALCALVFIGLWFYGWFLPDATIEPTAVETGASTGNALEPAPAGEADDGLVTPDATEPVLE